LAALDAPSSWWFTGRSNARLLKDSLYHRRSAITASRAHEGQGRIQGYHRHKRTVRAEGGGYRFVMHAADDVRREIELALVPFVLWRTMAKRK
jgi:hypothetical protein